MFQLPIFVFKETVRHAEVDHDSVNTSVKVQCTVDAAGSQVAFNGTAAAVKLTAFPDATTQLADTYTIPRGRFWRVLCG